MKVLKSAGRRRGVLALLAMLGAAAPLDAAAQESGVIRGRVVSERAEPVAGASVLLGAEQRGVVTDAAGHYRLESVRPGSHVVRVEALGYRPAERTVRVAAGSAAAADFALETAPVELSGLTVSATRSNAPLTAIPGSVTLIGREEIETQARLAPRLGEILSQKVPGLSAGTQSMSIYGQSLRGRNVSVLIDGVPQSTSRNVMRDFATIDPSAVERIEVLRGATSVYGDGATGGVINIITRSPAAGPMRFSTELGLESSLTNPDGSMGPRLVQSVSGRQGALDFVVSGSLSRTGGFYDGEGDLIPADPHGQGGIADMDSWNVFGKVGTDLGKHRLQLSVNRFQSEQDTEYTTDPAVNAFEPRTQKARALAGLQLAESQAAENLVGSLEYRNADVLGSRVRGQLFARDYTTRFSPFDGRRWYGDVVQSFVDSEKFGGRLELETPLPSAVLPALVWGLDYTDENTFQSLTTFDAALFDQSGGMRFVTTGVKAWVPPIHSQSLGLFVQAAATPVRGWELRGGVRQERVRLAVDDFTTVTGNPIVGGVVDFDPVLLNLGTVVSLTEALGLYGSYAEGFSLSDVGRALRGAAAGTSIGDRALQPQQVEQYEVGLRGLWPRLQASLAAFRNESELGTNLDAQLNVVRAPERVYGVEATLDAQPLPAVRLGATLTWNEGESYAEATDSWTALNGYRIQPLKWTAYTEHQTLPAWSNRLQLLYSGSRDRAFRENPKGYGVRPIESFWVVDYLGSLRAGPGSLTFGVQNLLNQQYYPTISQLLLSGGNTSYAAARGATLTLGYSVSY